MNKRDFFVKALSAQEYKRSAWVISAFALIAEDSDAWKKNPYPYRVINMGQQGYFFVDPENNNQLSSIEGTDGREPLFAMKEPFTLVKNELPNNPQTVKTNYGTALANAICLCYPFGNKISYIEERFSARTLEKLILPRLKDNPEDPAERRPEHIYVDEYLKFADAMFSLVAYSQLCVPAHTEKSLIQCPGIYDLRDQLLEQYKDRLHDPATIAVIDAALIAFYKDWLKDDDSMGFLINKKSINIVRKKLFMMHGAETGLEENVNVELIKGSLSQGWDISAFPAMNNSLRAGSYMRGQQTELGGVAVKELLRASSNLRITDDDCGSTLGVTITADPGEEDKLIGFTALINNGTNSIKITDENVGQYLGKTLTLRSPMFCRLEKTDYCKACVGDRLASSPTGLPTVVSAYGSTFLSIMMAGAHAKQLVVAKMDYKTAIM
jgi:hypothetical protein